MSSHFPCRLIVDPPQSGAWNMAVDEALLSQAASDGVATLRFYGWNEPTLSLGYFQKYADRAQHPASTAAAIVRRQSGGGAILHDHELTYSLALPRTHPLAVDAPSLYNAVHEVILAVLRNHLPRDCVAAALKFSSGNAMTRKESEPFLCFQRRSAGDIVFGDQRTESHTDDHKIVGSAQRRNRGAVLQHGSILLARSDYAPELAGLCDLCDNNDIITYLSSELSTLLPKAVGIEIGERKLNFDGERKLNDQHRALATALLDEKYGNRLWNQRR